MPGGNGNAGKGLPGAAVKYDVPVHLYHSVLDSVALPNQSQFYYDEITKLGGYVKYCKFLDAPRDEAGNLKYKGHGYVNWVLSAFYKENGGWSCGSTDSNNRQAVAPGYWVPANSIYDTIKIAAKRLDVEEP